MGDTMEFRHFFLNHCDARKTGLIDLHCNSKVHFCLCGYYSAFPSSTSTLLVLLCSLPPPPAPSGEHHRQSHSHQGIPRGSSQPQGHLACGDRGCARARGVGQDQPGEVPQGRAVHDRRAPVPAYWDRRGLQAASGQRQLAPGRGRPGLRGRAGEDSHRRCPQAHARPAEQRWRQ